MTQKISFDCLKCLKNLQLEERIYKKAYEGHETCLSCRPIDSDKKLTDEHRERMWQPNTLSMLRYNLEHGTQTISNEEVVALIDDIEKLRSSEQAWKEEAEKAPKLWVCPDCAFAFDSIHEDVHGGYSCPHCELIKLSEIFNQAIEVLEWIAECGTDYQSIRRARGFISSLKEDKT